MPDYALDRLGSRAFEQMATALFVDLLGPTVQVFGDGRDGGREAVHDGPATWTGIKSAGAASDGTNSTNHGQLVMQAKFNLHPSDSSKDRATWIQRQISSEIGDWAKALAAGKRERSPDYLLFVTNVRLSSVARTGGVDTTLAHARRLIARDSAAYKKGLRVKDVLLWHADQLGALLDANQAVRYAYTSLLTAGDVLAALGESRPEVGALKLDDPLRREMIASLNADRWIRLSQAGGGAAKTPLDELAVDLPVQLEAGPGAEQGSADRKALEYVLKRGNMVLRARQPDLDRRAGVVLVGGPGQGKSTFSQLIAQLYRAFMLDPLDLGPSTRAQVEAMKRTASRLAGVSSLPNRRWPVLVDLARYAEHLSTGSTDDLLRWISGLVSSKASTTITPVQLETWLRVCPWVLVLDGLDEVPSLQARLQVFEQVDAFLALTEDLDADVLTVVTTRPTGYDERLPETHFEHLQLTRLSPESAATYARHFSAIRLADDPSMRDVVQARVLRAANNPVTAHLMVTPLQVAIISLIVESKAELPIDRFSLFQLYYKTVYEREVDKSIRLSRILNKYRQHVDYIHAAVAARLQAQSEAASNAEAVLPRAELSDIVTTHLLERGYDLDETNELATQLVDATLSRLVLIVPRGEGVGYEVRTLQEFLTARLIIDGTDEEVLERLRLIAFHPHWRNTWLLAAGGLLAASERHEAHLTKLLRSINQANEDLARRITPNAELASELVVDGLISARPSFARALIQVLTASLNYPVAVEAGVVAEALASLLSVDQYRNTLQSRFKSIGSMGPGPRAAADLLLTNAQGYTYGDMGRVTTIRLMRESLGLSDVEHTAVRAFARRRRFPFNVIEAPTGASDGYIALRSSMDANMDDVAPAGSQERRLLEAALDTVKDGMYIEVTDPAKDDGQSVAVLIVSAEDDVTPFLALLEDGPACVALDVLLEDYPPQHWTVPAVITSAMSTAWRRRPVGTHLASLLAQRPVEG